MWSSAKAQGILQATTDFQTAAILLKKIQPPQIDMCQKYC